jgi:hypothetical protein
MATLSSARRLARRGPLALLVSLIVLAALPAVASAAATFVDASRTNNNGDCLTPATACKTIGGGDGAIAKASPGFAVHVEPGTYAENVTLTGGVSLVAESGNPVIEPATGPAVTVTGTPAVTISGLTFASSAAGPEIVLGDAAGNVIVTDNSFIDRTPNDANQVVGIRTTSTGAPRISANGFTLLHDAIQVLSPTTGAPGRPQITANTIVGVPDFGSGVTVRSTDTPGVTAATTAALTGNQIEQGAGQSTGVDVLDGGSIVGDPTIPGAGVTLALNRILGGGDGLRDFAARGPVSLFGDVIARTGSVDENQVVRSAIRANQNAGLGGDVTVTNADLVENTGPAIQLSGIHLDLDSSIVTGSISQNDLGASSCTITFSAGPTTSGNSCQTFQTAASPSFVNPDNPTPDFHLDPARDQAFIDHGNPAAPPLEGTLDFDGDPRVIDGACPIGAVRDIGADEFNAGTLTCVPADAGGQAVTDTGQVSPAPTGRRAAALKKCRHKHGKIHRKCVHRAKRLPL